MRLKAAISLLFFLLAITTASAIQQRTSSYDFSPGNYNKTLNPLGIAYSAAGQSNQAVPPSSPGTLEEHFEARRQNFKSGREMLLDKGVPFEPEELLRDRRSKAVKDALDAMPEMHQSRYETAPLKGAYIADTLYLPENVQVDGHTVIVANYVVFEGKNPVIKGPFDVVIIPSKPIAVLGMSVAEALHRKSVVVDVGIVGRRTLPSFLLIRDLQIETAHITIDTSGPKPQTKRTLIHKSLVNLRATSWNGFRPVLFQNQDTTGAPGFIGSSGTPGPPGNPGESPAKAPNGTCAASFNGEGGFPGGDGGNGGPGGPGGQGGPGGTAGNINVSVLDGDLNSYSFIANGGAGGLGGEAGNGGQGGAGGKGGDGGNGIACTCNVGEGGDAGHGGNGAVGGTGGTGGQGGTGGNGGTITVSLPAGSPGATTSNSGGHGGQGGGGGFGGIGGIPGAAGIGGSGASACGTTAANGASNFGGLTGASGASGNPGLNGSEGLAGPAPTITFRSAPPPPPPPGSGTCTPTGSGSGFKTNQTGGGTDNTDCSPIIIDLSGNGFSLTSAASGVMFDIGATGTPMKISWTAQGAANAFLALDRNGNGVIDNGSELFGNITPQPTSAHPNGFLALGQYDSNGDGVIDAKDPIYSQLRLWVDANHDGLSQPRELHTLPELGVFSISLDYSLSMRTDEFGNVFRYKAKINQGLNGESDAGKKAYDVFFVSQ